MVVARCQSNNVPPIWSLLQKGRTTVGWTWWRHRNANNKVCASPKFFSKHGPCLYLFWITIFQTNILVKTNKCHHWGLLGAEDPGQLSPLPPLIRPCCTIISVRHPWSALTSDICSSSCVFELFYFVLSESWRATGWLQPVVRNLTTSPRHPNHHMAGLPDWLLHDQFRKIWPFMNCAGHKKNTVGHFFGLPL